jgi:hypothetical protein
LKFVENIFFRLSEIREKQGMKNAEYAVLLRFFPLFSEKFFVFFAVKKNQEKKRKYLQMSAKFCIFARSACH